ncbi:MAG: helix-turn-helix transcriptional regulator [Treponema sp.]|nr:helix-turn-helix transcriptional regulator [Treponema sp.]MEE3312876.1 helix-turn-helix transcriptional regulator [Treponema sp.]
MSFNENLKEAMYCKNLTTMQLAALTDINSGTISNYLKTKGSMPPADKALKLAKALDVSVDFLVNGFDEKTKSSIQQKSPFPIDVFKIAQKMEGLEKDELEIIASMINLLKKRKDSAHSQNSSSH